MIATHSFPMPRDLCPPKEPMSPLHLFPMSSYTYRVVPPEGADIGFLARWVRHLGEQGRNNTLLPSRGLVGEIYGREVSPEEWGGTGVRWEVTLQLEVSPAVVKTWLPTYLKESAGHPEKWGFTKGQEALREEFPKFDWVWRELVLLGVGGTFPLELERTGGRWKASMSAPHIGEGLKFSTSSHDKAPDAMREMLLLVGQLRELVAQLSFLGV